MISDAEGNDLSHSEAEGEVRHFIPVSLRNRLISGGLKLVLSLTNKQTFRYPVIFL